MSVNITAGVPSTGAHVIKAECKELGADLTLRIDEQDSVIGRAIYLLRETADQLEQHEHRQESGVAVTVSRAESDG